MSKIYFPIVIKFGSTVKELLDEKYQKFYEWLASIYFNNISFSMYSDDNIYSNPFSNIQIQSSPIKIYEITFTEIERLSKKSIDLFIIDIRKNYNARIFIHFSRALDTAIESLQQELETTKFVILISEANKGDLSYLEKYIESGKILIILDKGSIWQKSSDNFSIDKHDYISKLAEIEDDPYILLKYKLIKRLGHFKRILKDNREFCHRFFYDGSKCISEVTTIFKRIFKEISIDNKVIIIIHCPQSPWLKDAISSLNLKIETEVLDFHILSSVKPNKIKKYQKVLFITDMIRTGETFKDCYKFLKSKFDKKIIIPYSVLATNVIDKYKKIKIINIDNEDIQINCLLPVEQFLLPSRDCELCKLGIPETSKDEESYDMFSSYDYWDLSKLAGYKSNEDDVPPHRDSIGKVCDYSNMIIKNGSWITFKIEKLLESYKIPKNDLVFICPDESMPKIFSNILKMSLPSTIIRIPRIILNELKEENLEIANVLEKYIQENPAWYFKLTSLVTPNVIIIDEFNVSCKTFKALYKLISYYGHYVSCYIPLIDFAPEKSSDSEVPTYSLYKFQLNL